MPLLVRQPPSGQLPALQVCRMQLLSSAARPRESAAAATASVALAGIATAATFVAAATTACSAGCLLEHLCQ